jgi:signal transduction histidine kinase/tetratricopeptide (TPR) repeat protein
MKAFFNMQLVVATHIKSALLLLAFFLTIALPGFPQSHLADSLLTLLQNHPHQDTLRVYWLNELSEHIELMPHRSDSLSRQALELSRVLKYEPGEITALGLHSSAQARIGNMEQALTVAKRALELANDNHNPRLIPQALWRLAFVYRYQRKFPEALETNKQALKRARRIHHIDLVSKILNELGLALRMQGELSKAKDYFLQSLVAADAEESPKTQSIKIDILRNLADVYRAEGAFLPAAKYALQALEFAMQARDSYRVSFLHVQLSYIYNALEEPSQALSYGLQALNEAERFGELTTVAGILNNIGSAYAMMKQYPEAVAYYQRSLKIVQQLNNQSNITAREANLADVYELQGNYDLALKYGFQAMARATALGDKAVTARVQNVLSRAYLQTGRLDSSRWYGERSLKIAQEISHKSYIKDAYQVLSQVYAQQNDSAKAYRYQLHYSAYNDSISSLQASRRLTLLQYQTDLGKKQSEINLLSKNNELQTEASKRQQQLLLSLFGGLILTLLLASVLWKTNQQKQKSNAQLLRLNKEIEQQRDSLDSTLKKLKSTQEQLVLKEKMASLGELTAGIAHEIQNPLNFINNFSEVSAELMEELRNGSVYLLEYEEKEETQLLLDSLTQNLTRIHQHGKRADAIVKSMLQHSLSSTGQKEPTDMNALADEYLLLSYHGMRAKDKEFIASLRTDFDSSLSKLEVVPQEMGRVLLNIFNNAFYALQQKKALLNGPYQPEVTVSTHQTIREVEIRVNDNGIGIPDNIIKKVFQPFFTTKPSGQGTGLGLSLSYDIITKGHGGEISVSSKKGEYTEVVIKLPLNN